MIIKRILLNNAGPFLGEWEVELPLGVTAVVAGYEGEGTRSNRAGKSYFASDAPRYALGFGFRGRRADDFVHRLAAGEEPGFVELEVETSEGAVHVLRRGRDGGSPVRLLDGQSVSERDLAQAVREEILGLSEDEYLATNAFVQGEMHGFMSMTPAKKRELISPWFQTDRWVPRAELARTRLRAAQAELRALTDGEAELRERADAGPDPTEVAAALEERNSTRGWYDEAVEARLKASAALRESAEARREVVELEAKVRAERAAAEEDVLNAGKVLRQETALLSAAANRAELILTLEREAGDVDALRDVLEGIRGDLRRSTDESDEAERARTALLTRYAEAKEGRTGRCPVLSESCDRIEADVGELDRIKREGLKLRRLRDRTTAAAEALQWSLDGARADLSGARRSAEDLAALRAEVSVQQVAHTHESARRALEDAEAHTSRVKLGRTEAGRGLARARKSCGVAGEGAEADDLRSSLETAQEAEHAAHAGAEVAAYALTQINFRREESLDAARRLTELGEERAEKEAEVRALAWTAYACGAAGIPSRELENAFGVAEVEMNGVLHDLGAATRLRFSPTRELKDWEPACLACGAAYPKGTRRRECAECGVPRRRRRADELRLEVLDGEAESEFDLDSGGGKILLSVAARLGLSAVPGASRRVRCEHLLLDEPDGALDGPNRSALYALLRDRLPALGIRQAIFVTHTDVREEFPSVVTVHRWADEDRSAVWVDR